MSGENENAEDRRKKIVGGSAGCIVSMSGSSITERTGKTPCRGMDVGEHMYQCEGRKQSFSDDSVAVNPGVELANSSAIWVLILLSLSLLLITETVVVFNAPGWASIPGTLPYAIAFLLLMQLAIVTWFCVKDLLVAKQNTETLMQEWVHPSLWMYASTWGFFLFLALLAQYGLVKLDAFFLTMGAVFPTSLNPDGVSLVLRASMMVTMYLMLSVMIFALCIHLIKRNNREVSGSYPGLQSGRYD